VPVFRVIDQAELAARASHFGALVFTEFTLVGTVLALLAWWLAGRLTPPAREYSLLALSIAVLAWFGSITLAVAWVAYAVVFHAAVERTRARWLSMLGVGVLLTAMIVLPVAAIGPLGERGVHVRAFTAFATNMAVLRFHAYAWDRWHGRAEPQSLAAFLLAMFFFPTFVNGPVEVPREFAAAWVGPERAIRRAAVRDGVARVALGVAKLLAVALALPPNWTTLLESAGDAPALALWGWSLLLYVWFFLSFSAWTDVGIGLGLLCGHRVPENFHSPWLARDTADFWRRWHVTFGIWLRDYVYIPLGGRRRHRALNVLVTFLVSAAWHIWGSLKLLGFGFFPVHAWDGLLVWGLLNAVGVLAAAAVARAVGAAGAWGVRAAQVGTLLFASLCWLAFFLPPGISFSTFVAMVGRMLWPVAS